ncbi:MAG: hypothetical protein ACOYBM_07925 [Dethiobacteria bacterium]|jgi:Kef-type K+ transport system membrane component KefB
MDELNIYGVALVPVMIALLELLKRSGVPKRLIPFLSIVIGVFMGFYYLAPGEVPKAILLGIVLGLSSIGLYSGTKNTLQHNRH